MGREPDGLLTLADEAIELPPGVEACHPSCLVALGGNEENVPKAVVVKAALEVEVALPFLGRREGTDPSVSWATSSGWLFLAIIPESSVWCRMACTWSVRKRPSGIAEGRSPESSQGLQTVGQALARCDTRSGPVPGARDDTSTPVQPGAGGQEGSRKT